MSITMTSATMPILKTMLSNLSHCLSKAKASAEQRKFDPSVLLQTRLYPDMLPLAAQVRIACDISKYAVVRLAGVDAPSFEDAEATLDELQGRIAATLAYLNTVTSDGLDGTEDKDITIKLPDGRVLEMKGEAYLKTWVLPNVFFHITMTYALLRHNGVDLGKADYLMGGTAPA